MELFWILMIILICLVGSYFLFRYLNKVKREQIAAEVNTEALSEIAVLKERLQSREAELKNQKIEFEKLLNEKFEVQELYRRETGTSAAMREKALQIPELLKRLDKKEEAVTGLQKQVSGSQNRVTELQTTLDEERKSAEEKLKILEEAKVKLNDAFKALSSDALKSNNRAFLELAKNTLEKYQSEAHGELEKRQKVIENFVKPLLESLDKYDKKINEIENARMEAYGGLKEQINLMTESQNLLKKETGNLIHALRTPQSRGRWGEITLKNVVEMAGMSEHCDFVEQESVETEGGMLRPDMIVKLPNDKQIIVDAKTPLLAYLDAVDTESDEVKNRRLKDFAVHVKKHIQELSQKAYWDQFTNSPDFVVLFLPGENFYRAALEQDQALIETGIRHRVIIATPTTLIALLRTVAFGWRQEKIAENAHIISELGKQLYDRIVNFTEHFDDVGKFLSKSIESYNKSVGNIERRVLVTARKFKELGAATDGEIKEIEIIDREPRTLQMDKKKKLPGKPVIDDIN